MNTRKEDILDALIAYLVEHGLANLSLRPMAANAGTSARLLIFHFQSKEKLVAAIFDEMQARLRLSFSGLMARPESPRRVPPLRLFWNWATGKRNFPYLRILYELQILALQNPEIYGRYLKNNSLNWVELVLAALPKTHQNHATATLYCAVFDGLFLELMSTGNKKRTSAALENFIVMARQHANTDGSATAA